MLLANVPSARTDSLKFLASLFSSKALSPRLLKGASENTLIPVILVLFILY